MRRRYPSIPAVGLFASCRTHFSPIAQVAACALLPIVLAGCGQTGAPLPPSLQLPIPVSDLTAARVANRVTLKWTMPHRTTDNLPLKGPQPVHICRRISDGPCTTVADVSFTPQKPATYDDTLPAELTTNAPQLLAYSIEVQNRHGRSAGGSNIAYTASGVAPPPFSNAHGEVSADGVVLQWQPTQPIGDGPKVEIQRTLLSAPKVANAEVKSKSPLGGTPALIKDQTLVVRLPSSTDTGQALDPDAAFDQRYSYRISRIATLTLDGKSIEIAGPQSSEIVVDTRDTFPPRVPTGLFAVAATNEGAVDLSWAPGTEKDLAGYAVYRREANQQPQRISPAAPLPAPAFRDSSAQLGREYFYSVTAIDRDGNESARSTEAAETLSAKP
jgi:hypothetical protein